jgi:hypothetical protein
VVTDGQVTVVYPPATRGPLRIVLGTAKLEIIKLALRRAPHGEHRAQFGTANP